MRTDAGMLGLKNVNIFLPRPFSEALMSQTSASSVAADLQSAERSCSGYARGEPFVELPTARVRYPCCRLQVRSTDSFPCSNASTTLQIASSLGSEWEKMNFKVCQEIQDLVFPEGVLWDKENRPCSAFCEGCGHKKQGQRRGVVLFGSGRRTRTTDLRVMSPTSYQLLYPAMLDYKSKYNF